MSHELSSTNPKKVGPGKLPENKAKRRNYPVLLWTWGTDTLLHPSRAFKPSVWSLPSTNRPGWRIWTLRLKCGGRRLSLGLQPNSLHYISKKLIVSNAEKKVESEVFVISDWY
jgi:hypothetical protein